MDEHRERQLLSLLECIQIGKAAKLPKLFDRDPSGDWSSTNMDWQTTITIPQRGLSMLFDLVSHLRRSDLRLRRAANEDTIANVIRDEIVELIENELPQVTRPSSDAVWGRLEAWLAANTESARHVIPCRIMRDGSAPFEIGPVRFTHAGNYDFTVCNALEGTEDRLLEFIQLTGANWIADVRVSGREPDEARRIAAAAVDVALSGLQAVADVRAFDRICRAAGARSVTRPLAVSVSASGRVTRHHKNEEPGLSVAKHEFEQLTQHAQNGFAAMGHCLSSLLDGGSTTQRLDEAWCDAAYWYHEALAHSLDTVRVTKLETCLEVLLKAESTRGSKSRLLQASEKLLGLPPEHVVQHHRGWNAEVFINHLVTARSRVLHGTLSTLENDLPTISASDIRRFTRVVLLNYARALDDYRRSTNPDDDLDAFFNWVADRFEKRRAAAGLSERDASSATV